MFSTHKGNLQGIAPTWLWNDLSEKLFGGLTGKRYLQVKEMITKNNVSKAIMMKGTKIFTALHLKVPFPRQAAIYSFPTLAFPASKASATSGGM